MSVRSRLSVVLCLLVWGDTGLLMLSPSAEDGNFKSMSDPRVSDSPRKRSLSSWKSTKSIVIVSPTALAKVSIDVSPAP